MAASYRASVIIPVYNQKDSLAITLKFFRLQSYPMQDFEVIVIDDGSTDGLLDQMDKDFILDFPYRLKYIRQENQGRAVARNRGVAQAESELLIFCDADRFPEVDFVTQYVAACGDQKQVSVIGCAWDFFGKLDLLLAGTINEAEWKRIQRFSRRPAYYGKLLHLYNEKGETPSGIAWASFLVGNSCVRLADFEKVSGFDEDFKSWGFEHFELGLRLQNQGVSFLSRPDISNYHIPHPRGSGYYQDMIKSSIEVIQKKHPTFDFKPLMAFLFGEISLQDFEVNFTGKPSEWMRDKEPIVFKTPSL